MITVLVTLAGIDLGHRLLPNPNSVLRDRGKLFALALGFRGGMGMFRTPGTAVPEMAVPEMAVPGSAQGVDRGGSVNLFNSGGDLALPTP